MVARRFDEILANGIRSGQIPARTQSARDWYREQGKKTRKMGESAVFQGAGSRLENQFRIGNMYTFIYDPKHKSSLPYYDRMPLIFPINRAKGGFLGINFHYLPLQLRAKLMDALYDTVTNDRYDESTKLNISYKTLAGVAKYRYFAPTVKHYLTSHLRSRLLYIAPAEWDSALFMPIAKFEGATQTQVWADSRKALRR